MTAAGHIMYNAEYRGRTANRIWGARAQQDDTSNGEALMFGEPTA